MQEDRQGPLDGRPQADDALDDLRAATRTPTTVHGTQKPVECMRRPILNNSSPGQAVYEPFMGSGTTLIAAETTGRICLGIELNPAYVDVAVERWQRFTGAGADARRHRRRRFDAREGRARVRIASAF